MKLSDLRTLAEWHGRQANIHFRDIELSTDLDAQCRNRDLYHFHAQAEDQLNALAEAFATLGQLTSTQS